MKSIDKYKYTRGWAGALVIGALATALTACEPKMDKVEMVDEPAPIFPDYAGIIVPCNIAPLNFTLRNDADYMTVKVKGQNDSITVRGRKETNFSLGLWRSLLTSEIGNDLEITVTAHVDGRWVQYQPFYLTVSPQPIDPYLSYRLIEPGYEVWNKIQLCERNLENFDERVLADNRNLDGACMNCHIYGNGNHEDKGTSMFHLRGPKGGTIMIKDGKITKLTIKPTSMETAAVYGDFSPGNRYCVFSSNLVRPTFHTLDSRRLEVYDEESDVFVVDLDRNMAVESPLVARKDVWETFPVFSPDCKWVYYCSAPAVTVPDSVEHLRYSICRIPFDSAMAEFGDSVEVVWSGTEHNASACHPKISPDGKFLLFTEAAYGTFPIWHKEADLRMLNLETGEVDPLDAVNGPNSDTYHSWSSNGRWFVFASKRDDGQYGRPYISFVDTTGVAAKPFLVPLKRPTHYNNTLKSYNIPDLSPRPVTATQQEIEDACKL
ncbi:MAG: hypothetical protein LUD17_12205 [Bacteroidales bacterium]|nr:hypothetical protein [Bacteroidales bacterium]